MLLYIATVYINQIDVYIYGRASTSTDRPVATSTGYLVYIVIAEQFTPLRLVDTRDHVWRTVKSERTVVRVSSYRRCKLRRRCSNGHIPKESGEK